MADKASFATLDDLLDKDFDDDDADQFIIESVVSGRPIGGVQEIVFSRPIHLRFDKPPDTLHISKISKAVLEKQRRADELEKNQNFLFPIPPALQRNFGWENGIVDEKTLLQKVVRFPHCTKEIAIQTVSEWTKRGLVQAYKFGMARREWCWCRSAFLAHQAHTKARQRPLKQNLKH